MKALKSPFFFDFFFDYEYNVVIVYIVSYKVWNEKM